MHRSERMAVSHCMRGRHQCSARRTHGQPPQELHLVLELKPFDAQVEDAHAPRVFVVYHAHGTLEGLRVIKLLGCVYSAPEFTDQHLVINGASDLLHEIFGKEGDGYHARSALGFAALPTGAAVEVEAVFEIMTD